jgi:carbamoyl-phosphate synthase small subunit
MSASRRARGKLVLADGTRFDGRLVGGGSLPVWGEVVFNTSMTGYQEVLTDPSYAGQIVVMTYPQIGNYGVHDGDNESATSAARGLVVRDLSEFFSPGRGRKSLEDFMIARGLPGLTDVDTRSVTLRTRSEGAVAGVIGSGEQSDDELLDLAVSVRDRVGKGLVASVSPRVSRIIPGRAGRAVVIDFGSKESIIACVRRSGAEIVVMGTGASGDGAFDAEAVLGGGFDAAVLSNGPGDPADLPGAVAAAQRLVGQIPVLGVCLGHQIAALALGGKTYKLKFGHRGANQPVVSHRTGRVHITSQNHGYAVGGDIAAVDPRVRVTYSNLNDGTVEGFADDERLVECVQFHPEASPGPHDTSFIFDEFFARVRARREAAGSAAGARGGEAVQP